MNILVVAATELEIPLVESGLRGRHQIDVLVTGVGMVATAAHTARRLAISHYDLAFNFGLCGSFDRSLPLGSVVHVVSDRIPELGAEDGDRFLPLAALGFADADAVLNVAPPEIAALAALPAVNGITVNTVHGHERSIAAVVQRCHPQVETMEGAAFAFACTISSLPYAQVRAVSNVVERRSRGDWHVEVAVRNLNDAALRIIESA